MRPEELKEIRKKLDLSQKKMADLIGVSLSGYQHYEYGRRKIPKMTAMFIQNQLQIDAKESYYEEMIEENFLTLGERSFDSYNKKEEKILEEARAAMLTLLEKLKGQPETLDRIKEELKIKRELIEIEKELNKLKD